MAANKSHELNEKMNGSDEKRPSKRSQQNERATRCKRETRRRKKSKGGKQDKELDIREAERTSARIEMSLDH